MSETQTSPSPCLSRSDPECRRLREYSEQLAKEARASGDATLARAVEDFLSPYLRLSHRLPRSARERLNAQRLLRRVLEARGCYGVVYGWYEAFKAPFGEDVEAGAALYARHLRAAADGYGWIRGYDTVLECGCGAESLGLVLARHNRRWIASDIYRPEALPRLESMFGPVGPFEFALIDGITLGGVEDDSVDVVISRSFFEHLLVDDGIEHLRHAHRVLRPGGFLVCACPAGIGPPSDVTKEFDEFDTPQGLHIKEYRVVELARAMQQVGYGRIESRFLRLRGLGRLPPALNKRNRVPIAAASALESIAHWSWPLARGSRARTRLWKQVWGHLGAASLLLIATKHEAVRRH